jgi:hypothetical protein
MKIIFGLRAHSAGTISLFFEVSCPHRDSDIHIHLDDSRFDRQRDPCRRRSVSPRYSPRDRTLDWCHPWCPSRSETFPPHRRRLDHSQPRRCVGIGRAEARCSGVLIIRNEVSEGNGCCARSIEAGRRSAMHDRDYKWASPEQDWMDSKALDHIASPEWCPSIGLTY